LSKSKRGFEKIDMHVVITIELMTIISPIITFKFELFRFPCFFTWIPLSNFLKIFKLSWSSTTIVVIIVGVRGGGNNKSEK
jgi:hypothetical protein